MGICECIVVSLCVIIIGLWGLVVLAGKFNFLEEEKKNTKKAYDDNLKRTEAFKKTGENSKKVAKEVEKASGKTSKAGVRTKKDELKFPELPKEVKKKGRPSTKKGGHLD